MNEKRREIAAPLRTSWIESVTLLVSALRQTCVSLPKSMPVADEPKGLAEEPEGVVKSG